MQKPSRMKILVKIEKRKQISHAISDHRGLRRENTSSIRIYTLIAATNAALLFEKYCCCSVVWGLQTKEPIRCSFWCRLWLHYYL